jgi:hypothetical protein
MPGDLDCICGGTGKVPGEAVEADPEESPAFLEFSQVADEQEYLEEVVNV